MKQYLILAWRLAKVLPVVGMVFVLGNAPNVLRRKGYVFGLLEVMLDLLPVICLIKASIEATLGNDLIPEKTQPSTSVLEAVA
ncbi:MAG: hypothetical protein HYR56_23935 [Acidobacteria bacterium]|nr:hypothetical protein [Acidobacteriota bacterium]MBI3423323.1 hypothetical protein [Acidobacteriota bacterium]